MKKILLFMTAVLMILLWKPIATNAADVEFVHGMYFGSYDELRENVVTGAWGINGTIYHTGIKKTKIQPGIQMEYMNATLINHNAGEISDSLYIFGMLRAPITVKAINLNVYGGIGFGSQFTQTILFADKKIPDYVDYNHALAGKVGIEYLIPIMKKKVKNIGISLEYMHAKSHGTDIQEIFDNRQNMNVVKAGILLHF